MNEFYDSLLEQEGASVEDVARKYGRHLKSNYTRLLSAKNTSTSPYYVGLSSQMGSFTHVTKRVALVADTMLLSEHGIGAVHELGETGYSYSGMAGEIRPRPMPSRSHGPTG
ncbi:hypothetical protein ACFU8Q_36750 [Streptomyces sp. NPDC057543]|uniref:hypothetical protein n=1 Tax=Streptomyces sp. NPDC057543 TaxID=3346163 RepID=UPI00367437C4